MLTVGSALAGIARRTGAKTALICGEQRRTYEELNRQANRIAWTLHEHGVRPGERVALLLPNGLEMAEFYFGLAKAGVVAVPLQTNWTSARLEEILQDADIHFLIADPEFEPMVTGLAVDRRRVGYTGAEAGWMWELRRACAEEPDFYQVWEQDPIVLVYTSGTTGRPKGVVRSHYSHLMIALTLGSELGISRDFTGFAILPMYHVNSMWFVTLSVAIGATCVIYPHRAFHPVHVLEELQAHHVQYGMFVPSLLTFLADAVESRQMRADDLRLIMTSSAPLDSTLRERLLRGFPQARLYDVYGSTEYGAATVFCHTHDSVTGSVGYPVLGQEVSVRDESGRPVEAGRVGEVYVRGPAVMRTYWNNDEANRSGFSEDGFLTVGDLGYRRQDGLLFLVDRKSDRMIVAGQNVYPSEIEGVLQMHPCVALTVAFGVPDLRRGEMAVALTTLKDGCSLDPGVLDAWCRAHLEEYKCPRRIEVVPNLPLGPVGKVVRQQAKQDWLKLAGVRHGTD